MILSGRDAFFGPERSNLMVQIADIGQAAPLKNLLNSICGVQYKNRIFTISSLPPMTFKINKYFSLV
jgi:hypothetical protein